METIELKPRLSRIIVLVFLMTFIPISTIKYLEFICYSTPDIRWFSHPDFWLFLRARGIEGLIAAAVFFVVHSVVCPWKCLHIILNKKTLQVPMKKGIRWKSVTVNLSDICVSRTFKDWLNGTQVVTSECEILRIGPLFYSSKAVNHLLDEIERRQKRKAGEQGQV